MFYDPTPPLSSSWSEWSERMNRPSHYEDIDWTRPFKEYTGSYTSPRIRRFEFSDDSPRMSRTSSRSDVESTPETDESVEQEGKPPRVHRIPIMVECRDDFQSSNSRPQTPESARVQEEKPHFTNFETHQSNTVPRRRRRNVAEEEIPRSYSQSSAEPMYQKFASRIPERRRRNVTTVKVNCEPEEQEEEEEEKEKPKDSSTEIESIIKEVDDLKTQVENLTEVQDKLYRYLDEMLTRCMLKLDNIDTMGSEDIRLARKNAIGRVQSCIDLLEQKAHPQKSCRSNKENSVKENPVISLPFYEKQQQQQQQEDDDESTKREMTSETKQVCDNDDKQDNQANKSVIVLPYYETPEVTQTDSKERKPDENGEVEQNKNVIVVPYEKIQDEKKSPEKTVIMLPFHENKDENKNVIALPFHESVECNDSCGESFCTKL